MELAGGLGRASVRWANAEMFLEGFFVVLIAPRTAIFLLVAPC